MIKNPICFTRQGGHNYTSTSHIDGFYTNIPNTTNLQSHTLTNLNQNSDHSPVLLQLAPNTVVIKEITTPITTPRITYPIPPNNLQNLQTTFLDKQNLPIENLTQILQQDYLTLTQWEDAQHKFQEITNSLSQCIEQTCMTPPTPPLPNRVKSQGGFLPRTQQKQSKQQLKFQNPNCTSCRKNDRDTWPHLLSTCEHPYLKGLRIARHNKAIHLITQTVQANKHTRYYTLTNACNINNTSQEQTVPEWLINCSCPQVPCQCHARLRPDILCVIGAPNHTTTPLTPSHTTTIQFIEFTYCHDRFPDQAITQKHSKYDPLTRLSIVL